MEEPLDDTALSRDGSRYRSSPRDRLIISLSLSGRIALRILPCGGVAQPGCTARDSCHSSVTLNCGTFHDARGTGFAP